MTRTSSSVFQNRDVGVGQKQAVFKTVSQKAPRARQLGREIER
jgi:hypothetical protein